MTPADSPATALTSPLHEQARVDAPPEVELHRRADPLRTTRAQGLVVGVRELDAACLRPERADEADPTDGSGHVKSLSEHIYYRAGAENKRTIMRLMPRRPGSVMLDVGCGDGADAVRLARHVGAATAIGLELADHFAEAACARGVDVRQVDIAKRWPLDDCSVDVVHSNQVIEHLAETDHFMREIRRVLRPDGYAIVSTNNLASWHNVFALALGWQPLPCHVSDDCVVGNPLALSETRYGERIHRHLRVCTSRALAGLAEAHGLEVELAVGSGYYPFGARVSRFLARLDGRHAVYLVQRYRRA